MRESARPRPSRAGAQEPQEPILTNQPQEPLTPHTDTFCDPINPRTPRTPGPLPSSTSSGALRPSHPVTLAGGPGRSRFMANDSGADTRCILHTPRVLCIAHSALCIAHSAHARESRRHPSRKHHRAGQRSGWDRRGHPAVLADPISSTLPSSTPALRPHPLVRGRQ